MKIVNFLLLVTCIFIFGCAGYKVIESKNVFEKNGIKNLRVPLFVNKSIFPGISVAFTNELIDRLGRSSAINVDIGSPSKLDDDVLIGIITSAGRKKDVLEPLVRIYTGNSSSIKEALKGRPDFFVTGQYGVKLSLELILIKNPLLKGKIQEASPEVLFHHSIPIEFKVVNNVNGSNGPDSPGVTNYTNNRGLFDFELKKAAKKYAQMMENLIVFE